MSGSDQHCLICNKPIYVPYISKYTYKIVRGGKNIFACSYSCFRRLKEQYPDTMKYSNRVKSS